MSVRIYVALSKGLLFNMHYVNKISNEFITTICPY